jgi:alkanesulfonate monooxygenase SsuD/methylene tetrahydromethanopterin reductase-like flavin-dependent oxidoreductase (luciferase family)
MRFGIRFDFRNPGFSGVDMADRYRAALDMAEWADARGADLVTLSEHHGSDDGYLPSALAMAAALATRTTIARIDVRAVVAAFHDPLRLAEDAAVVDLLSGGRLVLTVAGGYVAEEFDMFGVGLADRPARVTETVAALRAAWTGQPFEFRGRPARVTPRPAQPGGPPVILGGSSEAAARRAARIADGFLPAEPRFFEYYRDECVKLGRPDPGPYTGPDTAVVVVAEDPEAAWPELAPYFLHEVNAYGRWAAGAVSVGYQPVDSVEQLRSFGQYRILTPVQLREEADAGGEDTYVLLHPMAGGIPPDTAWEHLKLFERSVLDR